MPGGAPALGDALDHAPCGFLSFGDDGRIISINATLLELLGYAAGELIGKHIEHLLTTGTRIFYQTHWFPLLRLHGSAEEVFLQLRTHTGEEIGVLANAVRRERDGRRTYDCVLMHVRERQKFEGELIRARRAAEQAQVQLEQTGAELQAANDELLAQTEELERACAAAEDANRAKSSFLAVMSHELRTPLNAIAGYAELLEMGIHGPVTDAQKDALARIKRGQRHLLRLVNDVLNLSRIEAGRVDYQLSNFAIHSVVDEVNTMVEPQLAQKGLSYTTDIEPGLFVYADREKVLQVLLNLLSNAIKFTPSGGRVTHSARSERSGTPAAAVEVSDTGIGIPEDRLDSVFEPFVQVQAEQVGRAQGSGLGLAISRDLARGMGGDLRARSRVGHGSTFTLILPRA